MVAQLVSTTAERLKERMDELGIKQVDVIKACEPYGMVDKKNAIGKSHLSQYINGVNKPTQRKLTVLARVLNVNEAWLIGYDVPKEPITSDIKDHEKDNGGTTYVQPRTEEARILSRGIDQLPEEQRRQAVAMFELMFSKYINLKGEDKNDT